MAMHIGEQTVLPNGQVHDGPAPGGLSTSDSAVAENPTARGPGPAAEPVVSEQASTQQQEGGTTAPRARPSGPGLDLLFPNLEWTRPGASSSLLDGPGSDATGSGSVRKQRIPYVLPVDSASGVPEGHPGVSSALGVGDMPSILMYAPERALTSAAADSMDVIPEHLILCVEEDAFERAWVAPQGYWRSAF